jgi:hypothetical protein
VHFLCYEIARRPGFAAVFADGQARFIRHDTSEGALRAIITWNGGEAVDLADLE